MDINVIISDFPFNNKINNFNYEKNNIGENNPKKETFLKRNNNNFNNNEIKNSFNDSYILKNIYNLNSSKIENDKNNNYLINELKKEKENFNKSSIDFISELRKMSVGKDNNRFSNSSSLHQSQSFNIIPSILKQDNKSQIQDFHNNNFNKNNNSNEAINNILKTIKEKDFDVSLNYNKENNDKNILSKTVNRQYGIKLRYENFDINNNYYSNNIIDNNQISQPKYNKYLRNPNYKNKKERSNSINDLTHIKNNNINRTYVCSFEKDKDNNLISNTDRYSCHYFYESKQ